MRRSLVGMAVLSIAALSPNLVQADLQQDKEIANRVQQGLLDLKDQGALRGFSIDLQVDDATVWLKGRVSSAKQETLALEMASRVAGVRQVVDDLQVATPTAPAPSQVATPAKPAEPQQIPNTLGSMRRLDRKAEPKPDHQVRPASDESNSDNALAQAIVKKLQAKKASGELRGFNIDLKVDNGDVVLKGQVKDRQQHAIVVDVARRVPGVRQVVDGLLIAKPIPATAVASGTEAGAATPARPLQPVAGQGNQYYPTPQQQQYALQYAQYAQQYAQRVNFQNMPQTPMPMAAGGAMVAPARFDHPQLPGYSWPSYAAHPNYAAVSYPKQYSPAAWPYIGPFYPYPQVPLGWRKVTLQWDDGWWFLDFKDK